MEMISNMNGTHYDELIVGTAVPVLTKNVTLKAVISVVPFWLWLTVNMKLLTAQLLPVQKRHRQFWHMIRT